MSPTDPRLAEMRRRHGGTWVLTYVVEGFDEMFVKHVGLKFNQKMAHIIAKDHIANELDVKKRYIHLKSIKAE